MNLLDFENLMNTFFLTVCNIPLLLFWGLTLFSDTEGQLANRAQNAPLLRYVDSMRTHGHRAARIDPLDLIHREEVAALIPERYGLTDENKEYNVNGILWTKRVGESEDVEEFWSLRRIREHLRSIYVGNIAYEVRNMSVKKETTKLNILQYMHSPSKTERLWFSHLLESQSLPSPQDTPLVQIDHEKKRRIHELLARSEVFDNFLQLKFPNLKRVRGSFMYCIISDISFSMDWKGENQCFLLLILCFLPLPKVCIRYILYDLPTLFFPSWCTTRHFGYASPWAT